MLLRFDTIEFRTANTIIRQFASFAKKVLDSIAFGNNVIVVNTDKSTFDCFFIILMIDISSPSLVIDGKSPVCSRFTCHTLGWVSLIVLFWQCVLREAAPAVTVSHDTFRYIENPMS